MDSIQYFKQNDQVLWRCLFIWACEGLSIPKALHIDVWEMAGVTAMAAGGEQTTFGLQIWRCVRSPKLAAAPDWPYGVTRPQCGGNASHGPKPLRRDKGGTEWTTPPNEEGNCFPHQLALGTSSVHAATRCTLLTLKHSIIAHMTKAIA